MKKKISAVCIAAILAVFAGCQGPAEQRKPEAPQEKDQTTAVESESTDEGLKEDTSNHEDLEKEAADKEQKAMDFLLNTVKEVEVYQQQVIEYGKINNTPENKPIMRMDSVPDPNSEDPYMKAYYFIYVGEITDNHTNRWNTFLVHQGFDEILVEDILTGKYIALEQWRKQNEN